MRIFVFGSSLTSSYWNGAATYYRGIYKNFHALGHEVTFAEPDAYGRQHRRDLHDVHYADVVVYQSPRDIPNLLVRAAHCDLIIKHSGVGADDELLEKAILDCRTAHNRIAFWDVDAPATLARVEHEASDPFRTLIPLYDFIFTYGGGDPVIEHYKKLGARNCYPIYNALDPETHFPVAPDPEMSCDLAFVGNRLPYTALAGIATSLGWRTRWASGIFAALLAYLFLGEQLTGIQAIGTAAIVRASPSGRRLARTGSSDADTRPGPGSSVRTGRRPPAPVQLPVVPHREYPTRPGSFP